MDTFEAAEADDETLLARLLAPTAGEDEGRRCADTLLRRFGSLGATLAAPAREVERTLGDGSAGYADRLAGLQQLILCVLRDRVSDRPLLKSSKDLKSYLFARLGHAPREEFRVVFLDAGGHLIRDELMGLGTIDHAPVYPREVTRRALELDAKRLVLVHNHPSGDPEPSFADLNMTDRIVRACAVFDIEILDHLVVAGSAVSSFRESGLLRAGATRVRKTDRKLKVA